MNTTEHHFTGRLGQPSQDAKKLENYRIPKVSSNQSTNAATVAPRQPHQTIIAKPASINTASPETPNRQEDKASYLSATTAIAKISPTSSQNHNGIKIIQNNFLIKSANHSFTGCNNKTPMKKSTTPKLPPIVKQAFNSAPINSTQQQNPNFAKAINYNSQQLETNISNNNSHINQRKRPFENSLSSEVEALNPTKQLRVRPFAFDQRFVNDTAISTNEIENNLQNSHEQITAANDSNINAAIGLDLARTANPQNQEILQELSEIFQSEPKDDVYTEDQDTKEPSNESLVNKLMNQSIPDQKDTLFDLHTVRCPKRTDQYTFFQEKQKTNQALKNVFETLNTTPEKSELADDPAGLTVPLMQHQRYALKWLEFIEKRHPYGGLLADDMGLGKTLTMLALVMAEKHRLQGDGQADENSRFFNGNTLVVCPPSLLYQWEMEVNTKFNFALLPLVFHSSVSKTDVQNIKRFDVVITTYDTILSHRLAKHIFNINWRRIILDEAHIIRNPSTQKSLAVCSLKGKHRWALTGTPIHNKETDVFALLKFIKFTPFDDRAYWNIWLSGHTRLGVLLRSIMLRRTKQELQQSLMFKLPPREIKVIELKLTDAEMQVHQAILSFSRPLVRKFIQQYLKRQDTLYSVEVVSAENGPTERDHREFLRKLHCDESNIGHYVIFALLLRLQQVCCHPGLAEQMLYDDLDDDLDAAFISSQTALTPKIKIEKPKEEPEVKKEEFHEPTIREILNRKNPIFDLNYPSSKMLCVLKILKERVFQNNDKAIIVSQYTGYLSLIESFLTTKNITVLNFNGKMSLDERQKSLDKFNFTEDGEKVLLLSLKCGGVGLNLTSANHLILMDLPWNPQLETQAQDRIYRLGQTKQVFIYKFLCTNTIEMHIKNKQNEKLKLASSVLTGADSLQQSGARFSIAELKKLFGIDN